MKRYAQLSKSQQHTAVEFALSELKKCVEMGLVTFPKPVSEATLRDYAQVAAEEGWYAEPGDKVIDDIATEET